MDSVNIIRPNNKIVSSVSEPVYTIPYLTALARSGLLRISSANLNLAVAGNVICEMKNNSTTKLTSVENILVNTSATLGYSLIRNATLSGSLTSQTVYNVNDYFAASTETSISSAANALVSVSGGNTIINQLSLTNTFNPIAITPIILQPGSALYFSASGALGLTVTINVVFTEYNL